jgi:RimJ/RimL family protein N-acetyltransferase
VNAGHEEPIMLGPVVEGKLIVLGPLEREHLPNCCRWSRDRDVMRYLTLQYPFTMEDEERWYARVSSSSDEIVWAILLDGRHIGNIGLHNIDWRNRSAGGGIWIGERSEHGKGFGREAMALRTKYAFVELDLTTR